jgi:hypothetical protein
MTERKATVAGIETGAAPDSSASDYQLQEDGGVAYTGDPAKFSQDMAAAVASGLELGSMPAPTGDPDEITEEKASAGAKANPAHLEKGAQV